MSHPIPHRINPAALQLTSNALARPPIRAAIAALLDDGEAWCTEATNDGDITLSPRDAASHLLGDFPVDALEPDLEKAAAQDQAGHHDSRALAALHILQYERGYHAGPRAAQIDEIVAPGTPDAFDHLIQFVGDGMPWNDGRPAAIAAEDKEIQQHVEDAFRWLHMLAHAPEPEIDHGWRWDCEVDVRTAVSERELGQHLMEKFERLDTESRILMLGVLLNARPRGLAEWRRRIAMEDPDAGIRQSAAPDPVEQLIPRDAGAGGQ